MAIPTEPIYTMLRIIEQDHFLLSRQFRAASAQSLRSAISLQHRELSRIDRILRTETESRGLDYPGLSPLGYLRLIRRWANRSDDAISEGLIHHYTNDLNDLYRIKNRFNQPDHIFLSILQKLMDSHQAFIRELQQLLS